MRGVRIGEVCGGRDNNFNLIRMVAASAVLVSHAWPIALGPGAEQPLSRWAGLTLGTAAVYVFFAISGFLIARSWDRKMRVSDWAAARILRLFPGLLVVTVLTALLLGPLVTALPAGAYFADPDTATYVPRNVTLVSLQYGLPGVFEDNPYPEAINGSLWTLVHEVACYLGVLAVGMLGLLRRPAAFAAAAAGLLALYALGPEIPRAIHPKLVLLRELALPFLIGTTLYVFRDRIPLSWGGVAALALLALAAWAADGPGGAVFKPLFVLWLSYATFALAWLPGGAVRGYNALGDYSYGLYIYAFPAQQLAVHLFGPMSPALNMALAFPAALLCAVLSWRFVEKPALAARGRFADLLARERIGG